jgi:hypothetical protein
MKRVVFITILLGLTVLVICMFISLKNPVRMIQYTDGELEELKK